ncbi:MAG TPA: pectinesterase family protein [Polyangiaceae bacterium]
MTNLFPLPGARELCPDPPLRLTFDGTPSLGNSGSLRVYDAASPGTPVASVDFSATGSSDTLGGLSFTLERPVALDGNTVVVSLKSGALDYGKRYFVTIDAGAIRGPGGSAFSVTEPDAWTFETRPSAPSSTAELAVALDGSGDFCSLQGALDALPNNSSAATRIEIGPGTYRGVVYFTGKHNVTVHGADRHGVVLNGVNNNTMNPSTRGRALIGADNADGLVIENLTIHNLTPQGGSQAEALRLQDCDQCVIRDADILSLQDTLLWSGRLYAENCLIAGNVDFVWGTGTAYFDRCEIRTVGRSGYIVQSRNGAGAYGYVFVDSRITSDAGITGSVLARIDVAEYPNSHVAYIDCTLGSHISSGGWTITGGTPSSALRFWEYGSKDESGAPISTSGRVQGSTQLSASQATSMRDKATVLGGWEP